MLSPVGSAVAIDEESAMSLASFEPESHATMMGSRAVLVMTSNRGRRVSEARTTADTPVIRRLVPSKGRQGEDELPAAHGVTQCWEQRLPRTCYRQFGVDVGADAEAELNEEHDDGSKRIGAQAVERCPVVRSASFVDAAHNMTVPPETSTGDHCSLPIYPSSRFLHANIHSH